MFQRFRGGGSKEIVLDLTREEVRCKQKMLAEYATQRGLLSFFRLESERFRSMGEESSMKPAWAGYPYENGAQYFKTEILLQKISELRASTSLSSFSAASI